MNEEYEFVPLHAVKLHTEIDDWWYVVEKPEGASPTREFGGYDVATYNGESWFEPVEPTSVLCRKDNLEPVRWRA